MAIVFESAAKMNATPTAAHDIVHIQWVTDYVTEKTNQFYVFSITEPAAQQTGGIWNETL